MQFDVRDCLNLAPRKLVLAKKLAPCCLFSFLLSGLVLLGWAADPAPTTRARPLEISPERLDTIAAARKSYLSGNYVETIRLSEKAIARDEYEEEWRLLLAQALMATGQYTNAQAVIRNALVRFPTSIKLRVVGHAVHLQNGAKDEAQLLLDEINSLASRRPWDYRDAANLVALGRAALLLGADPRRVLENFFDRVKKTGAGNREVYLASGEVALEKNDFDLAAKTFSEGLKKFPEDADLFFGLAQAYASSDRPQMIRSLETALSFNTNHVPNMLLLADHLVDSEEYAAAKTILKKALGVNPWHPTAWSYKAVLAHLENENKAEAEARETGLRFWKTNPSVDALIGKKLSQKYRFAEGSTYQRRALRYDSEYLPAKIQLAQDLLRLGQEDEGWKLAEAVHEGDQYDVAAYNLITLKGTLSKYQTLTNEDFVVRMTAHEAQIYGSKVLTLLQRARTNLCEKYGLTLERPTTVEIFANQKDFAVRTFGMPGNPGYLGVCFGFVITANSPATQMPHPANWQAVLWHEFCHVVTLQLTKNKMPRWLSEGISVYEERQANPTWGQGMTPKYREMVLGDELTPVSELSAAFLTPKSDAHLQFAYYESSLVVEFLIDRHGLDAVKKILRDLGEGKEINASITAHTEPMEKLEQDFAAFARQRAEKLAPGLDWEKPARASAINAEWIEEHPTNFYALNRQAVNLMREKQWAQAKEPLQKLVDAYPDQTDPNNAYVMLAATHRSLSETNLEREVLRKLAAQDADDWEAFLRLTELALGEKDWKEVMENSERMLAVNPLIPQPHRYLAQAYENLDQPRAAIPSYETVLLLDPPDPVDVHFKLGRLLHKEGDGRAKRHVLQALEEAPRFREAHRLLLEMRDSKTAAAPRPETTPQKEKSTPPPVKAEEFE